MEKILEYQESEFVGVRVEKDLSICQYVVSIKLGKYGDYTERARFALACDLIKFLNDRLERTA